MDNHSQDTTSDHDDQGRPSKSQRKRDVEAMQAIGTQLVDLSPAALSKLQLDDELLSAVKLAQKIRNTREGYRRQLQLIGKLMRGRDVAAIQTGIANLTRSGDEANARFHALEKWRDRILQQGDEAIQSWLEEYPNSERQKLRQLVRQAEKEAKDNKPPAAARELFKYLREVSETA